MAGVPVMDCPRCIGGFVLRGECINCGWCGWPHPDAVAAAARIDEEIAASIRAAIEAEAALNANLSRIVPPPAPGSVSDEEKRVARENVRRAAVGLPPISVVQAGVEFRRVHLQTEYPGEYSRESKRDYYRTVSDYWQSRAEEIDASRARRRQRVGSTL